MSTSRINKGLNEQEVHYTILLAWTDRYKRYIICTCNAVEINRLTQAGDTLLLQE